MRDQIFSRASSLDRPMSVTCVYFLPSKGRLRTGSNDWRQIGSDGPVKELEHTSSREYHRIVYTIHKSQ